MLVWPYAKVHCTGTMRAGGKGACIGWCAVVMGVRVGGWREGGSNGRTRGAPIQANTNRPSF